MRWSILPGMGATAAMYNGLKHKLKFPVNFIDWPDYRGEKTYADVARRVISENDINSEDVVGGSSLGGMIALEIAQLKKVKAVILLGSAVNTGEVQGLLAMLSPLAKAAPITIIQALAGKNPNLVSSMFAASDPEFIRAMCAFLPFWKGYNGPTEIIHRLHGRKDHVIPCPATGCEVIETAGHLLAITHATETAAWLQRVYEQLAGRQ